jgi:hypothetical protein
MDDRFFLELVTILAGSEAGSGGPDASNAKVVDASPVYMSKSDPLDRLVRDYVLTTKALGLAAPTDARLKMSSYWQVDLYVPRLEGARTVSFRPLADTGMTFNDAEKRHVLNNFDRLVAFVQRHRS